MLGRTYLRANRQQEAIDHLRQAYELDPSETQYQLFLGDAYVKAALYSEGATVLSKIDASTLPEQARGHLAQLRTVAYARSGRGDLAVPEAKKAAEADPGNVELWFAYGSLAYNEGDTNGAIDGLGRAAQLDPDDANKHLALAQALLKKARSTPSDTRSGSYRRAAIAAQKATSIDANVDNLTLLGECYLGAEDYDNAISSFRGALTKPDSGWLQHYYIGQLSVMTGQYEEAKSALEMALSGAEAEGDRTRIWKQFGFLYERHQEFDKAVEAYTKAGDPSGVRRVRAQQKEPETDEREQAGSCTPEQIAAMARSGLSDAQIKAACGGA